jgi:hypothetical protein
MNVCPQCGSDKIKYKCCGGRRCEACQFRWNVKRIQEANDSAAKNNLESGFTK